MSKWELIISKLRPWKRKSHTPNISRDYKNGCFLSYTKRTDYIHVLSANATKQLWHLFPSILHFALPPWLETIGLQGLRDLLTLCRCHSLSAHCALLGWLTLASTIIVRNGNALLILSTAILSSVSHPTPSVSR